MKELNKNIQHARETLANVESKVHTTQTTSKPQPIPPFIPRLKKSVTAFLQVLLGAWFFIWFDWPLGLQAGMIPMMIFAYLNAQLPFALVIKTILKSLVIALILGALFHFLLMPQLDSFIELSPFLAFLFFPFLYFIASKNPLTSLGSIMSLIVVKSLISISSTPPSYSFASFINTYIGMGGGFCTLLILGYLFETRTPRKGFYKLLTSAIAHASDMINHTNNPSDPCSKLNTQLVKSRSQGIQTYGKLRKLSAMVDYGQAPYLDRNQITSILNSYGVLLTRLNNKVVIDGHSKNLESLQNVQQWCVESLDIISKEFSFDVFYRTSAASRRIYSTGYRK